MAKVELRLLLRIRAVKLRAFVFTFDDRPGSGRVSRVLGEYFPIFSFYGSHLVIADKR